VKLIVGLGNPGNIYETTRHNIGFLVIDYFSQKNSISLHTKRFKSTIGRGNISSTPVLLVKPVTFMNRSGEAISAIVRYYQINPENLIIIHDDIDLAFGRIKIKTCGGSGGHRGIESLISSLATNAFIRIRIGIGRPPSGIDESEFVLQPFTGDEEKCLSDIIGRVDQCVELIVEHGTATAMNIIHKRISTTA
jgi:PTH1 family peptidyl-tRNA hydrolase